MKRAYPFFISAIVPRPIALVSTVNATGVVNVAPFSYFNVMCHSPPILVFSVNLNSKREEKDTLVNIRGKGECVINLISSWYVESANHTSGEFPATESEMEAAGLTPTESVLVTPPRIEQSALSFECQVVDLYPIAHSPQEGEEATAPHVHIVVCKVVQIHVKEDVYCEETGTVHLDRLDPVCRLGDISYGHVRGVFKIPRPRM